MILNIDSQISASDDVCLTQIVILRVVLWRLPAQRLPATPHAAHVKWVRPGASASTDVIPVQRPKPLRPPSKLGEVGGHLFESVLRHEREDVSQRNRLGVEPEILLVEFFERKGGGQNGVDEVEVLRFAGEQLILDLFVEIGAG